MKKSFSILFILFVIIVGSIIYNNSSYIVRNESGKNKSTVNSHLNLNLEQSIVGDLISYHMDVVTINIGDTVVDETWSDVPEYNVKEYSTTSIQGSIKCVHDDFYIYALITYPSSTSWIAIEFNSTDQPETSMQNHDDGWVFGKGTIVPEGALDVYKYTGDVHFAGNGVHPVQDLRNDLTYEYIIDDEAQSTYIEIRRPLDTQDPAGSDFVFIENSIFNIKFASSNNQLSHKNGGNPYLMNITPEKISGIPEPTDNSTVQGRTPEQIRADNEFMLFALTTFGLIINFTLMTLVLIYFGKR